MTRTATVPTTRATCVRSARTATAQVVISINESTSAGRYYCELYDGGGGLDLRFTYTPDEATYFELGASPVPGRLDTSAFHLILDHTPPTTTCYADWKGVRYSVSGPNPMAISADTVGFATFQAEADMFSFVRLSTP